MKKYIKAQFLEKAICPYCEQLAEVEPDMFGDYTCPNCGEDVDDGDTLLGEVYCLDCNELVNATIDKIGEDKKCADCGSEDVLPSNIPIRGKCTECRAESFGVPDGRCEYCKARDTMVYGEDVDARIEPENRGHVFELVKKNFGTTSNMACVGWILPDGSLINTCSGSLPHRDIDHREVYEFMGRFAGDGNETDAMNRFIEMGGIRTQTMRQNPSVQIATSPTADQLESIDDFFEGFPHATSYGLQFGFDNSDFHEFDEYWDVSSAIKRRFYSGYETELPAIALADSMTRSMIKYASSLPRGYFDGLAAALKTMRQSFVDAAERVIRVGGDATDAAEAIEDLVYDQLAKRMGFEDIEVVEAIGTARTASVTVLNPQTDDVSEIILNVDMKKADSVTVNDVVHMIDTSDVFQRIASTAKRAGSGITVKEIVRQRKYKHGYIIRDEYWSITPDDPEEQWTLVERQAYTPSGEYIGDSKTAYFLCKTKGIIPRLASPDHCVCSIGYNPVKKKWYGWSHRAICGFGIGDMIFDEKWEGATDKTPFKKHGDKKIETMEDAMEAAIAFAASVS
jgi:ribosomal protein L37AE/L43A